MQITIQVKNVYGVTKVYPICEKAKLFAQIAGTTTLTQSTLRKVEVLGYAIVQTAGESWKEAA